MIKSLTPVKPDWEELLQVIRREKTPKRVHNMELFHDLEVSQLLIERFEIGKEIPKDDPDYGRRLHIAFQRFMGLEYVYAGVGGAFLPINMTKAEDTSSELHKSGGRAWLDGERGGPIQSWEDFEKYPWDNLTTINTTELEWLTKNLPDDMMIIGVGVGNFAEYLCWLFGYEQLCYAMCEQRDLVLAVKQKLEDGLEMQTKLLLEFDRVKALWGFDDMGFKTGLLLGPKETRELVLPGHKRVAELAHAAGRPYLLHCCGNLTEIIDDLIDDVKVDAKHSFEDTIEDVREVKHTYGQRMAMLGGIDVDFLCRSSEELIRKRTRETIDICLPGGGWCLGTGNSVANYIPIENYLAMVDEGRRYAGMV